MLKYNTFLVLLLTFLLGACSAPRYPDYQSSGATRSANNQVENKEIENLNEKTNDELKSENYDKIALLLPLTSKYARAAKAFEDGFREAYRDSTAPIRPVLQTYDIGADNEKIEAFYNKAISENADFIVGPLGNEAIDALAKKADIKRPTLAIAQLPEKQTSDNLFGFSLSPEAEAEQVAEYAYRQGYRNTRIFRPDSNWGRRVAIAFEEKWKELGGVIDRHLFYPRGITDYSSSVRNLLGLRQSDRRHRQIEKITGLDLNYNAGSNNIDFLFLVANTQVARILVPQIRFHNGHNLQIFSISTIYSGGVDRVLDLDLDGVVFSDLSWILQNTQLTANAKFASRSRYQGTALDRIYDLGYESYHLLFKAKSMRNKQTEIKGNTMNIRIDDKRNFEPVFHFAQFKQGVARPLDP